jgi:hypothetical protein
MTTQPVDWNKPLMFRGHRDGYRVVTSIIDGNDRAVLYRTPSGFTGGVSWNELGQYRHTADVGNSDWDIINVPPPKVKVECWVRVYQYKHNGRVCFSGVTFDTEALANKFGEDVTVLKIIKVEAEVEVKS